MRAGRSRSGWSSRLSLALVASVGSVWMASCGSDARPPPLSGPAIDASAPLAPLTLYLPTSTPVPDPVTCEEAKTAHSYVGCDYWPTVLANAVWSYFNYAVVIANPGTSSVTVTVSGPNAVHQERTVGPGTIEKVILPWVQNLKGPEGGALSLAGSVLERGGAYHIVSSAPVVAYQFNALEYKRTYSGPADSYDRNACPGAPANLDCFSYSNDASLLLPSTAWTGSYRVGALPAGKTPGNILSANLTVTAASDGTTVSVALSGSGKVLAGGGIPATAGGGTLVQLLNAGDVMELVSESYGPDFSGSLVTADKPVEVFTSDPCIDVPDNVRACDHIEESVIPAESLGKDYIVTTPVGPYGVPGLHVVRLVGNRDGTTLKYAPRKPTGCPDTLQAGEVADCGVVGDSFVVQGTEEFGISSFGVGAHSYQHMNFDFRGDPDQTVFASALQFRTHYLFLAPDDYEENYAVVAGISSANPVIDGKPLTNYEELEGGYGVWRSRLGAGGSHTLTSSEPVGLQVMGYGSFTSYTYPGGLSLARIAPPPVVR